jgi:hypothetical protein
MFYCILMRQTILYRNYNVKQLYEYEAWKKRKF